MSINVNVNGNPVNIRRGTMVAVDPDYSKNEFQKRRLIRLEQVRQQSKDIAENVRNKVRNEKSKRLSDIEKRGEKEHRKWQARKLLALQEQYQECLKDIGLGHIQASLQEQSDNIEAIRKESHDRIAKERGATAIRKLQDEKQQELANKSLHFQKKTHNQDVENARSAMVANLNKKKYSPFKKKKRKKVFTEINIESRLSGGSASESDIAQLLNISSSNTSGSSSVKCEPKNTKMPILEDTSQYTTASTFQSKRSEDECEDTENIVTKRYNSSLPRHNSESLKRTIPSYPIDTRISDRIKKRTLENAAYEPNIVCDNIPDVYVQHKIGTVRDDSASAQNKVGISRGDCICSPKEYSEPTKHSGKATLDKGKVSNPNPGTSGQNSEQLPTKPTVSLRTGPPTSLHPTKLKSPQTNVQANSNLNKVQYYDHKNRYFKEYVPDNASVQKINAESIDVCPSSGSEPEYVERMYKRDRDAQIRGKKALEKEKVRRDYREMMQQLPVLQKQERIASIPLHNPKFHMSEDRLKEFQKKKQNRIENAYEKSFPKVNLEPSIITIPPKTDAVSKSDIPLQNRDFKNSAPILNVGSWDVDFGKKSIPVMVPKNVESDLIREAMKQVPAESEELESAAQRREYLQEMLDSITFQRNKLAKELSLLPENSNLHKLFGDLANIDGLIKVGKSLNSKSRSSSDGTSDKRIQPKKKKEKTSNRKDKVLSSGSAPSEKGTKSKEVPRNLSPQERERKTSKYHIRCVHGEFSNSDSTPSPESKPKVCHTTVSPSSKATEKKKSKKTKKSSSPNLQTISTQTTPKSQEQTTPKSQGQTAKSLGSKESKGTTTVVPDMQENLEEHPKESELISTDVQQSSELKSKISTCDKCAATCVCCGVANIKDSEIVIKIGDDGKPQICFNPTKLKDKKIIVKTADTSEIAPRQEPVIKKPDKPPAATENQTLDVMMDQPNKLTKSKTKKLDKHRMAERHTVLRINENKTKGPDPPRSPKKGGVSWREYLSQNSTNSSTSYYSPPEFTGMSFPCQRSILNSKGQSFERKHKVDGHLVTILRDKPQQRNIQDESSTSVEGAQNSKLSDTQLFQHIKTLLTMSRRSIDDLAVSSVSELSTPGSSVINMQSNFSNKQLYNLMKHFQEDSSNLLNYSCTNSSRHYNSTASATSSSRSLENTSVVQTTTETRDPRNLSLDDYCAENYPGVLVAYNKLAENCAKRIENLAAMIEKVRLDKQSILQSPESASDKENSTKYFDLPPEFKKAKEQEKHKSTSEGSSEPDDVTRQLLEIDYNFVEELKKMSMAEVREKYPLSASSTDSSDENDKTKDSMNDSLMQRYKNLLESKKKEDKERGLNDPKITNIFFETKDDQPKNKKQKDVHFEDVEDDQHKNKKQKDIHFEPLLHDIPRLPVYTETNTSDHATLCKCNGKSKPPPSKGLSVARRFNNDIDFVPHELSTILEAEGSRMHLSKASDSRISSKSGSSTEKANGSRQPGLVPIIILNSDDFSPTDDNNITSKGSSDSLPDILSELMMDSTTQTEKEKNQTKTKQRCSKGGNTESPNQMVSPLTSSSSASDLENMEAMLKSLGMGWAVATLRKTQEALALTSSSSSIDISLKQKEIRITDSSSGSEVSIRDVLGKQFLTKLSSGSGKTDDATNSFIKELQNISAIQGSGTSNERTTHRTSTPIQRSKTADDTPKNDSQPHVILSGESELSSVRPHSDDNCDFVPFYSLNDESSITDKSGTKNN